MAAHVTTRRLPAPVGTHAGSITAVVVAAVAVVAAVRPLWLGLALAAAIAPMALAAMIDVRDGRLPDRLVAAAAVPVLAVFAVSPWGAPVDPVGGVLAGAALLGGPVLLVHLMSPAAMGFGDVKASIVLGAALGLVAAELALWALCGASAAAGIWGLARRRSHVAFGPGLVAASVLALAGASLIGVEASAWR